MMRPAGLVMAVAMIAVAAGTFYGLDYVPSGLLPKALRRAEPPAPAPIGGATTVAETDSADAVVTPEPAQAAPADEPMTEADLAEPAPETQPPPTQVAEASEPAPVDESAAAPAPTPAAEEKPDPGWGQESTPAPTAKAAPKPAPARRPQTASTSASGEPPVEYAEPKEAPGGTPNPATPTTAPGNRTSTASAGPVTPVKRKPEADVIKPWWPDPAKMPANQLKLQYAGQVQGQPAVALLFSAPLNLDTLRQYGQIRAADGKAVAGQWELGKNPRLAVFNGVKPGRYTIILKPQITDEKGFMLGTTLQGPVYIQER